MCVPAESISPGSGGPETSQDKIEPSVQAENELSVSCSCQAPGTLKDACHTGEGHFLSFLVFSVNLFQS